jgi:hypothetical protein
MRIQVGIHKDVILQRAYFDDKGRFNIALRQLGEKKEEKASSPFAQMNAAEVVEEDATSSITLWPFKIPDEKDKQQNVRSEQDRGEMLSADITRFKNQLQQILEQYTSKDKITWSIFDGAAIAEETYHSDLLSQSNLDTIYKNIGEQFMAMFQPFADNDNFPMRLKLARQSKDKHYARLPDRYIKDNPFIEPMEVPEDKSRVKWTAYELKEGLNDGTPITRASADTTEAPPEGGNVFGQR